MNGEVLPHVVATSKFSARQQLGSTINAFPRCRCFMLTKRGFNSIEIPFCLQNIRHSVKLNTCLLRIWSCSTLVAELKLTAIKHMEWCVEMSICKMHSAKHRGKLMVIELESSLQIDQSKTAMTSGFICIWTHLHTLCNAGGDDTQTHTSPFGNLNQDKMLWPILRSKEMRYSFSCCWISDTWVYFHCNPHTFPNVLIFIFAYKNAQKCVHCSSCKLI